MIWEIKYKRLTGPEVYTITTDPTQKQIIRITDIDNKDKILKSVRERNQITFREKSIWISTDFQLRNSKDTHRLKD